MGKSDISPLKLIFSWVEIVFHCLMNGLPQISRYIHHHRKNLFVASNVLIVLILHYLQNKYLLVSLSLMGLMRPHIDLYSAVGIRAFVIA